MAYQKENAHGFKGNPDNRNAKGIRGPRGFRSELRKLANKLKEREEKALAIIDKSLNGEEVDKDMLQTGKWVVERIVSVTNAAIAEEQRKLAIKKAIEDPEDDVAGEQEIAEVVKLVPRLKLTFDENDIKKDD